MRWILLFAILFGLFASKGRIHDAYRHWKGEVKIAVPGGCVVFDTSKQTSFSDRSGEGPDGFSIYRGFGVGAIAWTFISRTDGQESNIFMFSPKEIGSSAWQIEGQGCYGPKEGTQRQVWSRQPGQPDANTETCSHISEWDYPTYMLFDETGDASAEVTCRRGDGTHCSGTVEIGEAIYRIGMWDNPVERLPDMIAKMSLIIKNSVKYEDRCTPW